MTNTEQLYCSYQGCHKEPEVINHKNVGPFHIRIELCTKHNEEFDNYCKVIEAKNVIWRPGQ